MNITKLKYYLKLISAGVTMRAQSRAQSDDISDNLIDNPSDDISDRLCDIYIKQFQIVNLCAAIS
jgi:hypothetical protein